MRRSIFFWCTVVVGIAAVSSFLIYVYTSGMFANKIMMPIIPSEKCSITQVSISESDPDTLLVTVKWKANYNNMGINFTDSIARDTEDNPIATLGPPTPTELPAYTERTLQVNISKLSSGRYMVALVTSAGNVFTSPYFTLPS